MYSTRTQAHFDSFNAHAPAIDPFNDPRKRWISSMYAHVAKHMHASSAESGLIMVHSWPDAPPPPSSSRRKLVVTSEHVGASETSSEHMTALALQVASECVAQIRAATGCSPAQRACYSIDLIERHAERAVVTLTV